MICRAEVINHLEPSRVHPLEKGFGVGGAWGGSIHANTLTQEVLGHDAEHLLDGTFGGVVKQIARHDSGGLREGGGNEDDTGSRGHVWESFLHQKISIEAPPKPTTELSVDVLEPGNMDL